MKEIINRLASGQSLNLESARSMFEAFLDGQVNEAEMASILTALKIKGESPEEIAGAALALKGRTRQTDIGEPVIDTCGTGGDGSGSFNISTASAFVVAGAGGKVAKHGNRSVTSKSGSADVLEALSVQVNLSEEASLNTLKDSGLGFFFAPSIHKSMRAVMPVRRALGFRTIFNLVGPLCNPVKLSGQVIGVGDPTKLNDMAQAAQLMKMNRTLLVCSEHGLDELTLEGTNRGLLVSDSGIEELSIKAEDYGIEMRPDAALIGGSANMNAKIMRSVLSNEPSAHRDAVVLNAGAALYIAQVAKSVEEGVALAKNSLETGSALEALNTLVEETTRRAEK